MQYTVSRTLARSCMMSMKHVALRIQIGNSWFTV